MEIKPGQMHKRVNEFIAAYLFRELVVISNYVRHYKICIAYLSALSNM